MALDSHTDDSVFVVVPMASVRVLYTFGELGRLLGCQFQVVEELWEVEGSPVLYYWPEKPKKAPWLPWSGFLGESSIRADFLPDPEKDLPAAIFYLLSDYEKYQTEHFDRHGRYDQQAYPTADWGLEDQPLVHIWAEQIRRKLTEAYPDFVFQPPMAELRFTVDIDNAWRYRHKGLAISLAGLGRSLLKGQFSEFWQRVRVLTRQAPDPNFTFDQLAELLPPEQTTYFALIDRNSPFDGRYTYQSTALRQLLQSLESAGNQVGIHPSYSSFQDPDRIKRETGYLREIIGKEVRCSRQHFLRFRYPHTFRALIKAGVKEDYTHCLYHQGGFPQGMARPFLWYDLLAEQQTNLMLYPTIVMDRSLQHYARMTPVEAIDRTLNLWEIARQSGGVFTLLLHNECLSETAEWQGWSQAIVTMVNQLKNA